MSSIPKDKKLWEEIKQEIKNKTGRRWNAYYSGLLVKEYKKRGGEFEGKKPSKTSLGKWFNEKWVSIGGKYPTYRPTKRIDKTTPLTINEIDSIDAKKQIKKKQLIANTNHNLKPFKSKNN